MIEDVDHVWTGGSLVTAIGLPRHFEFLIASHVVEHSVDPIGFFQDCEALLGDTGRISLVIPDKRFASTASSR